MVHASTALFILAIGLSALSGYLRIRTRFSGTWPLAFSWLAIGIGTGLALARHFEGL